MTTQEEIASQAELDAFNQRIAARCAEGATPAEAYWLAFLEPSSPEAVAEIKRSIRWSSFKPW